MAALTYRPELDGLRAIAVYLVVLFHAGMVTANGGFIGVDLFFVLSGFLVTSVIMREIDGSGTLGLGGFYARRVRRLLPAAVVVIVVTAALQLLVASLPARVDMVGDARAALLYVANWHFILESRDYFAAEAGAASPYMHFWSLAIEEQFYIVYPLLVLVALKVSRRPVRLLVAVLGVVVVVSLSLQVWRATGDVDYAYYATETRIYQLAAGALLAFGVRVWGLRTTNADTSALVARFSPAVAAVGLVSLLVVASRYVDASASVRGMLATVASLVAIVGLWLAPQGWPARLLALPVPRFLGQVSYGTYLWHWPVLLVLRQVFDVRPLVLAGLTALVATALAALSFQLLETPIRRSPRLNLHRWGVVVTMVTASALIAVLVMPQILREDRRPALVAGPSTDFGAAAGKLDRPVPPDLDLVAAADDVGPSGDLCTPDDLDACVRERGDGPHVLLTGDSHARMYAGAFDAMARDNDWTLSTNILTACPWQADQQNDRSPEADQAACRTQRGDFYSDVLPELDVDVVVAIGLSRSDEFWADNLSSPGGPEGETLEQLQLRTTEETAALITDAGPSLIIAKSTLSTEGFGLDGFDPIECLAAADQLSDCAVVPPLERPVVDGVYDVLATREDDVATVDFNPLICPDLPLCAPVIGSRVVWQDADHVSASFLTAIRGPLYDRLEATELIDIGRGDPVVGE